MDGIAQTDAAERRDLFTEAAARKGISSVVVEKDFWVCWALKRMVSLGDGLPGLIFKGGTSLSKVFRLIQRFSEDVDLSLDRAALGFGGDRDPTAARSGKERGRRISALRDACRSYVLREAVPRLIKDFATVLGSPGTNSWALTPDDSADAILMLAYPRSLPAESYGASPNLRPVVKLEFGARSEPWPASRYPVTPYAAEEFDSLFRVRSCDVLTLEAERTFWEKAVMLHGLCYTGTVVLNSSRHYHDVALVARTPTRAKALGQISLLAAVVKHNSVFFEPSAKAHQELARPGTLRLVPDEPTLRGLSADYARMREMIFGEPPSFESLTRDLEALETEINSLKGV